MPRQTVKPDALAFEGRASGRDGITPSTLHGIRNGLRRSRRLAYRNTPFARALREKYRRAREARDD